MLDIVVPAQVGAAGDFRIQVLLRVVHVRPGPALVAVGIVGVLVALVRVLGIPLPGMRMRVGELAVIVHASPPPAVHLVAGLLARPVVGQLRVVARAVADASPPFSRSASSPTETPSVSRSLSVTT